MVTIQRNTLIAHIATNLVTLVAAYFLLVGTQGQNEASMLESAFKQIERQNAQIIELRQMLVDSQIEIVNLKARLNENLSREQLLTEYLNALPFPAWIKTFNQDDGEFYVLMVNESYTREYGITNSEYKGKTDFDIHPIELASKYKASDMAVMVTGKSDVRRQRVKKKSGGTVDIIAYKFVINISQNEKAIGGVAIRSDLFDGYDLIKK